MSRLISGYCELCHGTGELPDTRLANPVCKPCLGIGISRFRRGLCEVCGGWGRLPTAAVTGEEVAKAPAEAAFWGLLHPCITAIAKPRFEAKHYADSVEAALKEVNDIVRKIVVDRAGKELGGAPLMHFAFSLDHPIIALDDLTTESGRNIQKGYMQIFAGCMTGIRNPKAHANISITPERAIHFLYLASLLVCKLDEEK